MRFVVPVPPNYAWEWWGQCQSLIVITILNTYNLRKTRVVHTRHVLVSVLTTTTGQHAQQSKRDKPESSDGEEHSPDERGEEVWYMRHALEYG